MSWKLSNGTGSLYICGTLTLVSLGWFASFSSRALLAAFNSDWKENYFIINNLKIMCKILLKKYVERIYVYPNFWSRNEYYIWINKNMFQIFTHTKIINGCHEIEGDIINILQTWVIDSNPHPQHRIRRTVDAAAAAPRIRRRKTCGCSTWNEYEKVIIILKAYCTTGIFSLYNTMVVYLNSKTTRLIIHFTNFSMY